MKSKFILAFCFIFISFIISSLMCNAQKTYKTIDLSESQKNEIISLLNKYHSNRGICSDLNIEIAHLDTFVEIGDYGPMWYGDTLIVNLDGMIVSYKFDDTDRKWHSDEQKFIPFNRSAIYSKYTCKFGDTPPSFGFSNRMIEWNTVFDDILSLIE